MRWATRRAGTGYPTIFVEPAAGGPAQSLLWHGWWPIWSPDGRWIAFLTNAGGDSGVAVMAATGGEAWNLGRADTFACSPDSKELATSVPGDPALGTVDLVRRPLRRPVARLEALHRERVAQARGVPDSVFADAPGLLNTLQVGDQIFVNAYLPSTASRGGAGRRRPR